MTLLQYKKETEDLIKRYKDYLLCSSRDAKNRTISWAIQEKDEEDESALINEIARLQKIAQDLRIRSIVNPVYLDQPLNTYVEEIPAVFNKTKIYV